MSRKNLITVVIGLTLIVQCLPAMATPYSDAVLADGPGLYWSFDSQDAVTGYVPEMAGGLSEDALWPLKAPGADYPDGWLKPNDLEGGRNSLGKAFEVTYAAPYSTYYIPDSSKTSSIATWTLEFWARKNWDANKYLFCAPNANHTTIYTGYAGTGVESVTGDTGPIVNFAATAAGWHHYAVIVDAVADTTTTILDGGEPVTISGKLNPFNWEGVMLWGSSAYSANTNYWIGAIDEFAIYDKALSAADIQRHHAAALLPPLYGDANRNGVVDGADAAILAENWLTMENATWFMGDFNGDGMVNDIDATILAANWQPAPSQNAAVPEPSTSVVLAGSLLSLLFGLRRKS